MSSAIGVYVALTEIASDLGKEEFTVSRHRIAQLCGYSVKTVYNRLEDLQELHLLTVTTPKLRNLSTYKLCRSATVTERKVTIAERSVNERPSDLPTLEEKEEPLRGLPPLSSSPSTLQTPLTTEPLRGEGLNGSRHSSECNEEKLPETEAEFMAFMRAHCEEMANWGGKWRIRWRTKPKKCNRVIATYLEDRKTKNISKAGGYMNDLWANRMA